MLLLITFILKLINIIFWIARIYDTDSASNENIKESKVYNILKRVNKDNYW